MPCRRAVDDTDRGVCKLSSTILSFSSSDQRRRKRISGRPRVTVRPYYEGPPFSGLARDRRKGGESRPDPEVECPPFRF